MRELYLVKAQAFLLWYLSHITLRACSAFAGFEQQMYHGRTARGRQRSISAVDAAVAVVIDALRAAPRATTAFFAGRTFRADNRAREAFWWMPGTVGTAKSNPKHACGASRAT